MVDRLKKAYLTFNLDKSNFASNSVIDKYGLRSGSQEVKDIGKYPIPTSSHRNKTFSLHDQSKSASLEPFSYMSFIATTMFDQNLSIYLSYQHLLGFFREKLKN